MNAKTYWLFAVSIALGFTISGVAVAAEPSTEAKPAAAPEFKLPPGWTLDDMKACMLAGTPGAMHELLAKSIGEWQGKSTMRMVPDSEPIVSESTSACGGMMDGRFVRCEMKGEMPGMGPYNGFGIFGYDNVAQRFNSIWLDNHSTGMMIGTGDLSADGKTITWKYVHSCPITKKPAVMREIETWTGPNAKTLEMFGNDPKTGKEFQMMKIEMTKK